MMPLRQKTRSALRRALQTCFFNATESILRSSGRRGHLKTRFEASWKWSLSICALLSQGLDEDSTADEILRLCVDLGIHSDKNNHRHNAMFRSPGIKSMPKTALLSGLECLNEKSILSQIEKSERIGIERVWKLICPEDIGSCFEIIKECQPCEESGKLFLKFSSERRKVGIHHTPYDVTAHMFDMAWAKTDYPDDEIRSDLVVADLAVGAGAFLIQAARILAMMKKSSVEHILQNFIIGFDIDSEVLDVCSLCFHLETKCRLESSRYNLFKIDSVMRPDSLELIEERVKDVMPESKGKPTIVIGNPPYVQTNLKDTKHLAFKSRNSGNLSAMFIEQAILATEVGKVVCQIVPLSVIQSTRMQPIRDVLRDRCSEIDVEAYGCVPGYMFDQGKKGANTSNAITQRVAIITAKRGSKTPILESTRFIRWSSKERNQLFDGLQKQQIPDELARGQSFPMIGDKESLDVLSRLLKTNRALLDLDGDDENLNLYIPKAVRYFATASRNDMSRSQIRLTFSDQNSRNLAQILLNSDYFYWYWRLYGNGFQISQRELDNLPIPSVEMQRKFQGEIDELAEKLHDNRHKLAVEKSNKGMIKNIKYDKDPILMADLDSLVHKLFELTKKYPFRAAKEKSLVDYQKHFR